MCAGTAHMWYPSLKQVKKDRIRSLLVTHTHTGSPILVIHCLSHLKRYTFRLIVFSGPHGTHRRPNKITEIQFVHSTCAGGCALEFERFDELTPELWAYVYQFSTAIEVASKKRRMVFNHRTSCVGVLNSIRGWQNLDKFVVFKDVWKFKKIIFLRLKKNKFDHKWQKFCWTKGLYIKLCTYDIIIIRTGKENGFYARSKFEKTLNLSFFLNW